MSGKYVRKSTKTRPLCERKKKTKKDPIFTNKEDHLDNKDTDDDDNNDDNEEKSDSSEGEYDNENDDDTDDNDDNPQPSNTKRTRISLSSSSSSSLSLSSSIQKKKPTKSRGVVVDRIQHRLRFEFSNKEFKTTLNHVEQKRVLQLTKRWDNREHTLVPQFNDLVREKQRLQRVISDAYRSIQEKERSLQTLAMQSIVVSNLFSKQKHPDATGQVDQKLLQHHWKQAPMEKKEKIWKILLHGQARVDRELLAEIQHRYLHPVQPKQPQQPRQNLMYQSIKILQLLLPSFLFLDEWAQFCTLCTRLYGCLQETMEIYMKKTLSSIDYIRINEYTAVFPLVPNFTITQDVHRLMKYRWTSHAYDSTIFHEELKEKPSKSEKKKKKLSSSSSTSSSQRQKIAAPGKDEWLVKRSSSVVCIDLLKPVLPKSMVNRMVDRGIISPPYMTIYRRKKETTKEYMSQFKSILMTIKNKLLYVQKIAANSDRLLGDYIEPNSIPTSHYDILASLYPGMVNWLRQTHLLYTLRLSHYYILNHDDED